MLPAAAASAYDCNQSRILPGREVSVMTHLTTLSTREGRTLERIYQHPMAHNLELRDVMALFRTIGAADPQHNGQIRLRAGEEALTLERPHSKDMSTDEVILIRNLLDGAGWKPGASGKVEHKVPVATYMVIVINHAGAYIHLPGSEDAPHHLTHYVDTKDLDRNREETFPDDQHFFSSIADAVADADQIVVISHGSGQSNEGDHLLDWLNSHRKDVRARVTHDLVADLQHTTTPELLDLAAHALAQSDTKPTPKGTS
jgi:hypothetical protein